MSGTATNMSTEEKLKTSERLERASERLEKFREDIRSSVNRHSLENLCDVPDFIIADFLMRSFNAFVVAQCTAAEWWSDRE